MHLLELTDSAALDAGRVGGKGAHLAALAQGGLPVPAAVLVDADAMAAALLAAGLMADARAERDAPGSRPDLRERVARMALPPATAAALSQALRRIPGPYAVRSSGIDEDGHERSFAGQHESVLGVAADDVPAAIARCWASLYAPGASAYRGRGPAPGGMAVVVQRLVEPVAAGVLFTVNPLTGSWREMTVEATWGLGAPIAEGSVAPHWYLVRRPLNVGRGWLRQRVRLVPMQEDLPDIPTQRVFRAGRVVDEAVPEAQRGRPTLGRARLLELCRLGLDVERRFGEAQDVEWALDRAGVLHVLQARPITRAAPPRERTDVLWTRRFVGERWPEPATPMGWSLIEPVLSWFIAYPRTQRTWLGDGPAVRLVSSRPYVNVTAFRYLAFKLPGAPPPQFMLELLPPEEEAAIRRRRAAPPDLGVYLSYFRETTEERRWDRFAYNPFTNPVVWDRWASAASAEFDALAPPTDVAGAIARVEALQGRVREYVGVHLCSLLFANIGLQLLEAALASWVPEQAAVALRVLATCPPGNETLRTNAALWALAHRARPGDVDALAAGRPLRLEFGDAVRAFLRDFGHRSAASWELFTPRWVDDPRQLAPILRSLLGTADPEARERDRERDVAAMLTEVRRGLSPGRRAALGWLVGATRRYLLLRENQRFLFDRLLLAERRALTAVGEALVARGALAEPGDVAFLTWDEARAAVDAPQPLMDRVRERRARRDADAALVPPVFLRGSEPDDGIVGAGRLQGLGISPGRARGPAHVVRSPSDAERVPAGAILVAEAIDPGWTSIFGRVNGVVLELGGRLSHGAVVAREYGLPAVVNLPGATRALRDGQELTVDGTRGIVWVKP